MTPLLRQPAALRGRVDPDGIQAELGCQLHTAERADLAAALCLVGRQIVGRVEAVAGDLGPAPRAG